LTHLFRVSPQHVDLHQVPFRVQIQGVHLFHGLARVVRVVMHHQAAVAIRAAQKGLEGKRLAGDGRREPIDFLATTQREGGHAAAIDGVNEEGSI